MKKEITTLGINIVIQKKNKNDYLSLTDIARYKNKDHTDDVIKNWLRNRFTIELLGLWETINNPLFNSVEFDGFRKDSGLNSFVLTPKKWIESTNAIGIISSPGRYGGTFAHKDIAFEFASWISVEFKLYLIKEFQRLKESETNHQNLQWSVQRMISKINYHIHTNAIKENLIPKTLTKEQAAIVYANEADLLNVALFGITAQQWKQKNPNSEGSLRDQATLDQLVVLSNMESINALLIQQGISSQERIIQLNQVAITQMKSLMTAKGLKRLGNNLD
jgi:hypothetical protein